LGNTDKTLNTCLTFLLSGNSQGLGPFLWVMTKSLASEQSSCCGSRWTHVLNFVPQGSWSCAITVILVFLPVMYLLWSWDDHIRDHTCFMGDSESICVGYMVRSENVGALLVYLLMFLVMSCSKACLKCWSFSGSVFSGVIVLLIHLIVSFLCEPLGYPFIGINLQANVCQVWSTLPWLDYACSDYLFKLLLIGDSGVGKSCLLLRFAVWYLSITLFQFVMLAEEMWLAGCLLPDLKQILGSLTGDLIPCNSVDFYSS
jgi:hypothetical protein